jgi:actin-related protein 10
LGEKIFGDYDMDEINIAISLLQVIQTIPCEVRKSCVQNIVLSGGTSMILGCYRRLAEEINSIFENSKEFNDIKVLKDQIKLHKIIFPRNTLTWIGGKYFS